MATENTARDTFSSAGLILFNAAASYELIGTGHGLQPLQMKYDGTGSWKATLPQAFQEAFKIDYEAVFLYAIKILDAIPPGPVAEAALQRVMEAVEYVVSHAGLLRLDLSGRIYHSALGQDLAKSFATFYTSIPAGELLAWLAVENWNDTVCDFACGSGTLVVSAYHRKLAISFLQKWKGAVSDLHRLFVEHDLWAFDAMPFAAHLTLVNLLLQQPNVTFNDSNVYHVTVGADKRLGSLDLLKSDKIVVQKRITGAATGATRHALSLAFQKKELQVPRASFDVVIMNPPFTKKQRVTQMLDRPTLAKVLKGIRRNLTASGGLPIPFVALGDLSLKPGGRLALVLPSAVLGRDGWIGVREILFDGYHLEHILISWAPGRPAFSEQSSFREVLIVARKNHDKEEGKNGPPRFTIASHLDEPMNFTEARQIADVLRSVSRQAPQFSIKSHASQPLSIGAKRIGEAVSFPRVLVEQTVPNWYRLVAFRQPKLTRQALTQTGLMSDSNPPYGFHFSKVLSPISELGQVSLFVKSVKRAGFAVVSNKPGAGGIPVLMTSDFQRLFVREREAEWLVRDFSIRPVETFHPGSGLVLLPRKSNVYSTLKVGAVVGEVPMGGSMWIPVTPKPLKTQDGSSVQPEEVARIICVWSHSIFGILTLLFERQEIEGAWSEWLTEALRERHVLNPGRLSRRQVDDLLSVYDKLESTSWSTLVEQLAEASGTRTHPRVLIDSEVSRIVLGAPIDDLTRLYSDIKLELTLLSDVMSSRNSRQRPSESNQQEEDDE